MPSESGAKTAQSRAALGAVFLVAALLRAYEMSELDHFLNGGGGGIASAALVSSLAAALLSDRGAALLSRSSRGDAPAGSKSTLSTAAAAGLFFALYQCLWLRGLQLCGPLNVLLLETADIALFSVVGGFLGQSLSGFAKVLGGGCMTMGYALLMWSRAIRTNPSLGQAAASHNAHPLNGIALVLLSSFCLFLFNHFFKRLSAASQAPLVAHRTALLAASLFLLPVCLTELLLARPSASPLSTLWCGALAGALVFFSPLLQRLYSHRLGERLHFIVTFSPAVCLTVLLYFFQHGGSIDLIALVSCVLIFGGHSIVYSLMKLPQWMHLGPVVAHIWSDQTTKKLFIYFLINLSFMFVEFLVGILTNSLGMISDAGHMLFDSTALLLGLIASYMASWPPNDRYSYGYGRVEVLTGFVNGVFLVMVAISIATEAFHRFLEPPEVTTENLLLVAVLGLLINLVGIFFFHGEHDHNDNLRGVFLHVLADTLGSVGVIISTLIIQIFHYYLVDPICAMIISLFILLSVVSLFSGTVPTLLQRLPYEKRRQFQFALDQVRQMPDVERVYKTHLWKLGNGSYVASLHVAVTEGAAEQRLLCRCRGLLQDEGIEDCVVQIEKPDFSRAHSVVKADV